MSTFPHSQNFLDEQRQREQWRVAEKLIKALQAPVAGGGPPTGAAGGDLSGTYPNPSIANSAITSAKISNGAIVNDDVNATAAIDATKIADGTVSSTEFQYINTLTSNAQTQFAAKANDADVVHDTGTETIAGDKTFSDDVTVDGAFSGGGGNVSANALGSSLFGDTITIAANVTLGVSGYLTLSTISFFDNQSLGPSVTGGEIIYSATDCLFFLDGGASNRTIYLNYDGGFGWTVIKNIGTTDDITVDADGAGIFTMTPVVLVPGQTGWFASQSGTGVIQDIANDGGGAGGLTNKQVLQRISLGI